MELWKRVPDDVWAVCQRLRDADLRNTDAKRKAPKDEDDEEYGVQKKDAIKLIHDNWDKDVLIYAGPPYVAKTRSKKLYRHEPEEEDHTFHNRLVKALAEHPRFVYLSGYRNRLYVEEKGGWEAREMDKRTPAKPDKELEILWLNPKASAGVKEMQAKKAAERAEAEKRRQKPGHMGMMYMLPVKPPEPEVKPEVALFGALIGAYLEEGE